MGTYHWPGVLALVLLVAVSRTEAGACRAAGCATSGGNGLFKYEAGHTYVYNLDGRSLADLPEQQGDGVKIELKATAEVHFGADCTNTLKLSDVQVTGPTAKKYGNLKELETHAVRFTFSDGRVEATELCAEDGDSNTALNIKRAVISLLQVSTPQSIGSANKHETDVFGSCPTSFTFSNRGGETHVTKSRNLNKCSHREDLRSRVSSTPYISNSELQSSPVLDSSLAVDITVKNGIVQSAESRETYLYRPFANKDAGAKTIVTTKLTLASHAAGAPHAVSDGSAKSLIFEAPHGDSAAASNVATIVAAMHDAKEAMPDNVGQAAATEFRHLVEVFRHSNKDDLLTVYSQVKAGAGFADKVAARRVFLDALFRSRTGDAIEVAVELIKSKEIPEERAQLWFASFSFMRHVTLSSINSAASLLGDATLARNAYLGVGALAGQYCRQHNCHGVKEIDAVLATLAKPIAKGCSCTNNEDENKIISSLKGLENVKQLNEATAELLRVCASDVTVPARVRVAALEAFRADACQPQLKKTAGEILLNRQEDSEIRIKAYLAAVECPCGKCANTLKELLDTEPVNQVGSFIVSHLRNIRASTNPDKALAKHHLSEVRTTKRFPFDIRRYSFNREFSYFLDALNVGSSVEQNVIYSQQSYLPRSKSLNLTTEIFGHSFNLLELSTRAENLDRVVEKWFGPKGVFRTHDLEELLTTGKVNLKGLREKFQERLQQTTRPKRSVPYSQLEEFRNQVALINDHKNIDLDWNLKMFGDNLGHRSYHGDAHEFSPERLIDRLFDRIDKRIEGLKSFDIDMKHHGVFLEHEMAYPTGLGFPLKMSVTGTAAVHLKLDGKIDLHAIIKDCKNAHIQFEIIPSAAVELIGEMTIDAYAVEAGVKASAITHSATGVNVDIKAVNGAGFDITVGLPIKKQEIVNFKSEVLSSVQERGQAPIETALTFNTKRKDYSGCFDQLSGLVGLTFCGDVSVPFEGLQTKAAFFPLNGPSKVVITVESDDVSTYKFRGVVNNKDPERRSLEILVDTPNSKTNRKLEVLLENNRKPNRELRASLKSPYKDASAELVVVNNDKEYSVTGRLLNDKDEYLVRVGAEITGNDAQKTFTPLFEYSTPTQKSSVKKGKKGSKGVGYNVEGSVVLDKDGDNKKFTFNNVVISAPAGKVSVNGWVAYDPNSVSSDLTLKRDNAETLDVKGKLQRFSPTHFKVDADVHASQYPDMGVSLKWDYNRGKEQLESNLVLVHGKDTASTENRVTALALVKYRWADRKDFDFSGKGTVNYPLLKIDGRIEGNASPTSVGYVLDGNYESYQIKSVLSAKRHIKDEGDYAVEFEAKVLDSSVKFETKRDILSATESKFATSLEIQPGGKYELTADVTNKREDNDVVRKIVAVAVIAGQPEPFTLDAGLERTGQELGAHAKVSVGSVDHIDLAVTLKRAPNPAGSFKVLLKDRVDGSGQFKYVDGTGSLSAVVDLKKMGRKIKAAGDVTVSGSSHVGNLDVYFNFDKDPSRKVHIETSTDYTKGSLDSKNTLVILDYTTVFNVKGTMSGVRGDGHLVGSADLTLPSGREINLKVDNERHVRPGNSEYDFKVNLATTPKGGAPVSVAVTAKGDKIDIRRAAFDTEFNLLFTNKAGKDVNYYVLAKSLPTDAEHRNIEFKGLIKGSLLELTPLVHVTVDIAKPVATYMVKVNLDADSNVLLNGKLQRSPEQKLPIEIENTIELNLPTGELKHIAATEKWSYTRGQNGAPCNLDGFISTTFNKEKTLKIEINLSGNKESGNGKLVVTGPKEEPRTLEGSWKVDKSSGFTREGSLNYKHQDKETHVDVKVVVPETRDEVTVSIAGRSPLERLQTLTFDFHGARKNQLVSSETTVVINEKKSVITTKYGLDAQNPIVEFSVVHPGGKSVLAFNFHRRESKDDEFTGELNLEHAGNALAAKVEARAPSAHDFEIKIDLDSERLKLNKLHIVLANKPAKGGKQMIVTATEAGEKIVGGKLDFHFEDGSNGKLFEATGNLKVRNENQAAKISIKRNIIASDSENGVEVAFIAALGDRLAEVNYKRTNKELYAQGNVCKDKGQCGHGEWKVSFDFVGPEISRDGSLKVDLTGLGRETNFAIKSSAKRSEKHVLHSIEVQTKTNEVYKYRLEITDKAASVALVTPQREVAAEAAYALTFDQANKRHVTYKLDASAWLDKAREPEQKASLSVDHDWLRTDDQLTVSCESKFRHPALGKDLHIKGKTVIGGRQVLDSVVEIDVFAKKGQKIVIDAKILKNELANGYNFTAVWDVKSKGQNLDVVVESHLVASTTIVGVGSMLTYKDNKKGTKELGFGYERTLNKLAVFAKSPKEVLFSVDASYKLEDSLPSVQTTIEVMGRAVIAEAHCEKQKLIYTIYKRDTPERKVTGTYLLDLSNKAVAQSEWVQGGEKKELYNVVLNWGKQAKPELGYSLENMKELLEYTRNDVSISVKQLNEAWARMEPEATTEITELITELKKAQPNLKPLLAAYQAQVKAIREEVEADRVITDAAEFVKQLLGRANESFASVTEVIAKIAAKVVDLFEDISTALLSSLKRIVPAITRSLNKIGQVAIDLSDTILNRVLVGLQNLVELMKKHEAEVKQVLSAVAEVLRDVGGVVGRTVDQIYHEVSDFVVILSDQLKALPMYSMVQERIAELREQLKEYRAPEQLLATLREITSSLKESLPTEELREFVSALSTYLEKVLTHKEKIDNIAELKAIYHKACAALRSVIKIIRSEIGAKESEGVLGTALPWSIRTLLRIPLLTSVHFSPLAFWRSDDRPSLKELLLAYRPTLNPLDFIPPYTSYGILLGSSHFFTLDKRHYTFAGSCSYLLAQDVVNGNFSVVLNMDNGKFKSLQISDATDTLEVSAAQTLTLNGQPHEFPLTHNDMNAWRRYSSINIKSKSGVTIKIDADHHIAVFHVSGFYHGQVRGLLGDLNNEPFDDFRMPNGKVTEDVAEFGNSYSVGPKCAPGTADAHHAHHAQHDADCTQLFSSNSPLRYTFPIIEPAPFREACDHYTSETADKKAEYACRIAAAYVEAAHTQGFHINVPDSCAQCTVGGKVVPVGETISLKSTKEADIVIIVEEVTTNAEVYKELVVPLVASLQKDLKEKGFSNVEVSLIGYGHPERKWPQHYTSGGKLTFDGNAKVEFGDANVKHENEKIEKWHKLRHRVQVETGRVKVRDAILEAAQYPWRAGASRLVVLVESSPCEKSKMPLGGFQRLRLMLLEKGLRDRGVSFHVVSPLDGFTLTEAKDAKQQKQVVGFDSDSVYSLSDAKKKVLEGNSELRDNIEYGDDVCVESALRTNGATFNSNNFLEGKASQRKQFLTVVSHRLVDSLTDELTEDCSCKIDHGVHAQMSCRVTGRKESEQLVAGKGKKGTKN